MHASPSTQYWVLFNDNRSFGPASADIIARAVTDGRMPEDVLVTPVGTTAWTQLRSVPEIDEAMRVFCSNPWNFPSGSIQPEMAPPTEMKSARAKTAEAPLAAVKPAETKPAEVKTEEKKDDKNKPVLSAGFKLLPLAIFGMCAILGVIEFVVATRLAQG